jgi:hypothetical protein
MTESGIMRHLDVNFYSTSSTRKLAFLNNIVAIFEVEVDKADNYSNNTWEGSTYFNSIPN